MRESNREMEKILTSLKVPQVEVINLGKPFNHLFEDFISELFIVLLPLDLIKFDLELKLPGPRIFYSSKISPISKNRKDPIFSPAPTRTRQRDHGESQPSEQPHPNKYNNMEC